MSYQQVTKLLLLVFAFITLLTWQILSSIGHRAETWRFAMMFFGIMFILFIIPTNKENK